ncbi:unnamed protein product [Mytilus coruscus]|uniref:Ig-like domain-containing protein n=1 Tax=Mytilus coruscus TaxID=42192 RepID=A0A6J8CKX4_MYTCO|nr:unnamed protein product [Mytilus coruscus]
MTMFTTEICLLLLTFLNSDICFGIVTVYTIPKSPNLRFGISALGNPIYCSFVSKETNWSTEIVDTSGEYDTNKYQIIRSEMQIIDVIVPKYPGKFDLLPDAHTFGSGIALDFLESDDKLYNGTDNSAMYLWFTYNFISTRHWDVFLWGYRYDFHLKIANISLNDAGKYTDDNIIYGQEGDTLEIACTTITGHDVEEISIQQNGLTLALNDSNDVTFSFKPDRKDNFKEYECFSAHPFEMIRVKLLVNYAPSVKVVVGVNSINCIADGFPQTYTFDRWEHLSENGEHIRFLDGLQNGTLILPKSQTQYQITDRYVCTVSNGILNMNGNILQKGFGTFNYIGAPKFVPGHRNVKQVKLGEPLEIRFSLYSNTMIEDVWIDGYDTGRNKSGIKPEFRISNTTLPYTAFGHKGNISGYEITIKKNILSNNDFRVYNIWAKNQMGVDSYRFEVIAVEFHKCNEININHNVKEITRFITSSIIATCLLVYIVVIHICFYVRQRTKRTRRGSEPESLHDHMYDEIGTISYQATHISPLSTDQLEPIQQIRMIRSSQPESSTVNVNNQMSMDRPFNTSSLLSVQEYQPNAVHPNTISGATIDVSPVLSIADIVHIDGRYCENDTTQSGESPHSFQSRRHQFDHSSIRNRTTTSSSSSDESSIESNGTTSVGLNIGDGYENLYQIVQERQDSHQYSCLTNQSEQIDNESPSTDTAELSRNNRNYVNLRL